MPFEIFLFSFPGVYYIFKYRINLQFDCMVYASYLYNDCFGPAIVFLVWIFLMKL